MLNLITEYNIIFRKENDTIRLIFLSFYDMIK